MAKKSLNFIDLFAGAGGLSEGFVRAGFNPIAHVEMDEAASFSLRTRAAYYFLKENGNESTYHQYLKGEINRKQLYTSVPREILNSVINKPIGLGNNSLIHEQIEKQLDGSINSELHNYGSNDVLKNVRLGLEKLDFLIENSKKSNDKIEVPVLFGQNGKHEKYFDADGYNNHNKTVIEVEAGRAVTNYQFLKDLFQACMIYEVDYLVIAVRKNYRGNLDFQNLITFFETLYASGRLQLPLKGILITGY